MKKNIIFTAFIGLTFLMSCTEEKLGGEGLLSLSLKMSDTEQNVSTRALPSTEELNSSCEVQIRNSDGSLLRKYAGLSSVPSELQLVVGNYSVNATAGTKVDAAFDTPYYQGSANFTIVRGEVSAVVLPLYVQNTVVAIDYTDAADKKFKTCSVTVSMSKGSLTFDKTAEEKQEGYFVLPNGETDLDWELEAVTVDGISYTKKGTVSDVKASTKYTLTFDYKELEPTDGGMAVTIQVAEIPLATKWNVEISKCPSIEYKENGTYSPLSTPFNFALNDQGKDVDIYVRTTSELKNLRLSCEQFKDILGLNLTTFDILTMAGNVKEQIGDRLAFVNEYNVETGRSTAKLTFTKTFFQAMSKEEKTYYVGIVATDDNGKYSSAQMKVIVSNAVVTTELIPEYEAWSHKATLKANVNNELYAALPEEQKRLAFQYRKSGTEEWITTTDEVVYDKETSSMSSVITGLEPGVTYEYRAYCAGQDADAATQEFKTETAESLINGSFEDWYKPGDVWLIYKEGGSMFWDSGNHGSATLKVNVTNYDESITAPGSTGKRSIKLVSQKVAFLGIGKFAAGNVFIGQYIKTDGTDGVLGFGRPWASRPTKLRGYYKYKMSPIEYTSSAAAVSSIKKGDNDNAHIYAAVGDWEKETNIDPPILIETKTAKLFDKTGKGVIAYGEVIQKESTPGEAMIPFEITLDYKDLTRKAKYLLIVASASRYGDYFVGGEGSTLWLDDLELVYE